jgi:hypothetical protein
VPDEALLELVLKTTFWSEGRKEGRKKERKNERMN